MTTDCNFAVAYARVSTKDQERTGHTLPMQSKNMQEYAQKRGLQIVKEFVVAESASKRDRVFYQEMWDFLEQHPEIKHIIFEEIDRFTRNDKDKVDLSDRVNNDGYVAHFVMEKLMLDKETSPNDIFLFDILAAKAKNYSQALSQKVKKGQMGKLLNGGYPAGQSPFGYTKVNSELVPDKLEALCVKKAFALCDEDHLPLSAIAKRLNAMGFRRRSHKKFSKAYLDYMLKNPIYSGVITWMGKTYQGTHEPLVNRRRFHRVGQWVTRKGTYHWGIHTFTYRGFLQCGECGGAITAEIQKGFIYYHCTHYHKCSQRPYTREETLEEQFYEILTQLHLKEKSAEVVKTGILANREEEYGFQKTRVEQLKEQYQHLIEWIDKIYDDKMAGLIDEEMYKRKTADYQKRKDELTETVADYTNGNVPNFEFSLNILELADRAADIYKRRTSEEKQMLLKILLSNALLKDKKVDATLRTPFDSIVKYNKTDNVSGWADSNRRPCVPHTHVLAN